MIESGRVLVNGQKADAIRKKLRTGDTVRIGSRVFKIQAEDALQ